MPFFCIQILSLPAVLQDLYQFCAVALLFQICFFMLYVARAVRHPDSVQGTVNSVVGILIAAVPTAVPTVVVAALAYCTVHLQRSHIELLVHAKIKTIADVEVICFDKTGTLTGTTVNALSWPFAFRLLPLANMCFGQMLAALQHVPLTL